MAREISYDVQAVKARALDAFFAKGFAETSLVDLESATGLNRRQLYNGFGDKRALFLSVLDDFADQAPRVFLADLIREGAGLSEIATTLRYLSDNSDTDRGRLGCLICNTAREAIVSDESVGSRVRQFFRRIEGTYRGAVDNAIAAGEIGAERNPERLARFLLGIHVSVCLLARAGESRDVIRDMVDESLHSLSI